MTERPRVYLRAPAADDRHEFVKLMRASRSFHRPWATAPTDDDRFAAYITDSQRADFEAMLVCRHEDDAIVGFFNLSQIVRRSLQSAYLGYAAGKPFAGHGLHAGGDRARPAPSVHVAQASPDRGQHSARKSRLDRARSGRRLPARGLLSALPQDRRALARPRALGAARPRSGGAATRSTETVCRPKRPRRARSSTAVRLRVEADVAQLVEHFTRKPGLLSFDVGAGRRVGGGKPQQIRVISVAGGLPTTVDRGPPVDTSAAVVAAPALHGFGLRSVRPRRRHEPRGSRL